MASVSRWRVLLKDVPRAALVLLPGRVRNADTAVAALGGLEVVSNACTLKTEQSLLLNLNPRDPLSKRVSSTAYKTCIVYFARADDALQPLFVVTQLFDFQALFDFYNSCDLAYRLPRTSAALMRCPEAAAHAPTNLTFSDLLEPPAYSRQTRPVKCTFEPSGCKSVSPAAAPDGVTDDAPYHDYVQQLLDNISARKVSHSARFEDDAVPSAPLAPLDAAALTGHERQLYLTIKKAFEQRPVWTRVSLLGKLQISKTNQTLLKKILAALTYSYSNGPWRGCIVRLGYDPKRNSEALRYQSIDFRDPHYRSFKFGLAGVREQLNAVLDFEMKTSLCKPAVIYMFCDIDDETIQKFLATASPVDTCTKEYGWMSQAAFSALRDTLVERSRRLRNSESAH